MDRVIGFAFDCDNHARVNACTHIAALVISTICLNTSTKLYRQVIRKLNMRLEPECAIQRHDMQNNKTRNRHLFNYITHITTMFQQTYDLIIPVQSTFLPSSILYPLCSTYIHISYTYIPYMPPTMTGYFTPSID